MSMTFQCPECQEYVHVCTSLAGLHTHCPSCDVMIPVPDHDMPPDAETATHLSAKNRWQAATAVAEPTALAEAWPWIATGLVLLGFVAGFVVLAVWLGS